MNRICLLGCALMMVTLSAHAELTIVGDEETDAAKVAAAIVSRPQWKIQTGDKFSTVFSLWSKQNQWELVWDAPEIISEIDVTIDGKHDFETVIEMVLNAVNRNGAKIRAVAYEANHVLRITDKK